MSINVIDIRDHFKGLLNNEKFVIDKTGSKVIEIIGASFEASHDTIFGEVNKEYVERELKWYRSMSLNVNDIPGGPPTIWKQVSDKNGFINSNYGWMIYSKENGNQFAKVLDELVNNSFSRRATMIYTRPSMHLDYNENGRSDFCCTWGTQHFIRDGQLVTVVSMRSNDAWAGYRNDYAWQKYVHEQLLIGLNNRTGSQYGSGKIYWNAGSLHIYERQFYLVDNYIKTGSISITKDEYRTKYPLSKF